MSENAETSVEVEMHLMNRRFAVNKMQLIFFEDGGEVSFHDEPQLFIEGGDDELIFDGEVLGDVAEQERICEKRS